MDVLLLSEAEVESLLDPDKVLEVLTEGFKALSEGKVVAPGRNEVKTAMGGRVMGMLAWQPENAVSIKLVSLFPENNYLDIPTHQALVCLFDGETGTPLCVMNGTVITTIRTAMAAALSVRLLSRPDSRVLAIMGAGVQSKAHLKAVTQVQDFTEIRIATRDFSQATQLAAVHPLARPVASFEEAARGADVICLCTGSSTPIVEADWIAPGTHVTSVGYAPPGGELDRKLIEKGKLFVETRLAFELPPVGCFELSGLDPETGTELGEVLLGQRSGRQDEDEITIYKAMGQAMEDMVTANMVYRFARQRRIGQLISL